MASGGPPVAVIIGGGLAGLTAAFTLKMSGWKVTVLEKEDEVGGRCRSFRAGDYIFDSGAQYFHDSYDDTINTAIKAGLGETLRLPDEQKAMYHDGRATMFLPRSLSPGRAVPWKSLGPAGLLNFTSTAGSLIAGYRSYNLRLPQWWQRGDERKASEYLARRVTPRYRHNIAEPVALYALGSDLERVSAAGFMVGLRFTFRDRSGSFTGGMGSLATAIGREIRVETAMEATEVVYEGRKATSVKATPVGGGRSKVFKADSVICAVPATAVPGVVRKMGREAQGAAKKVKYSPAIVVNIGFDALASGPGGPVLIARGEGFKASWACRHVSKAFEYAPAGHSVATIVFTGKEAGLLMKSPDAELVEEAVFTCHKMFDTGEMSIKASRVDRHAFGHPVVTPGHSAMVRSLLERGSGISNLFLAGDWTTSPTVEGAVASGLRAGETALAILGRSH